MILTAVRKLRSIPLSEWPEIVTAVAVAIVVEIGVRVLALPRLATLVGAPLDTREGGRLHNAPPPRSSARTRRQLRATRRVMRRWPFGDTCLRHALVLGQRLRRLHPVLCVGVAKVGGEVRAHAWLEFDGAALDPTGVAESYQRLEPVRPVDVA